MRADRLSLAVLAALLFAANAPSPAIASTKAAPPALDLRMRKGDFRLPGGDAAKGRLAHRPATPAYAVTLRDDPWSAVDERAPRVLQSQIPQVSLDKLEHPPGEEGETISLRKLLDGTTFTILRIELAPTY